MLSILNFHYIELIFLSLLIDINLSPYTQYRYYVTVSNGAGSINSDTSLAVTREDLPLGLDPPQTQTQINQLNTIYISWTPPISPNG